MKNKKAKQKQQQHRKTEIHHERVFSLINIVGVITHTIADWKACNKNMTSKKQSWRKEKISEKIIKKIKKSTGKVFDEGLI